MKALQHIPAFVFVLIATIVEASGDAIIRKSIYDQTGLLRAVTMLAGAALVFAYAFVLNLAPIEFKEVVGLYIATLFIVWQVINFIAFHTLPTLHIVIGGALIVSGGLIVTFWKP
jgi:hypothetical protein